MTGGRRGEVLAAVLRLRVDGASTIFGEKLVTLTKKMRSLVYGGQIVGHAGVVFRP
jgi:hypothetical protein